VPCAVFFAESVRWRCGKYVLLLYWHIVYRSAPQPEIAEICFKQIQSGDWMRRSEGDADSYMRDEGLTHVLRFESGDADASAYDEPRQLKDLTPAKFACAFGASCPAVLKDDDSNEYVLIGKRYDPNAPGIRGRVGPDEVALEISAELLEGALSSALAAQPSDILARLNSINPEAGQLFLTWWNALRQAASAHGSNAQSASRTETAAAPSS
jgi:hypothetical protein